MIQDEWICPVCNINTNSQGDILCSARAVSLHIAGKIKTKDNRHRKWAENNINDFNYEKNIHRSINTLALEFVDAVFHTHQNRLMTQKEMILQLIEERDSQEPRVVAFRYIEKIETGLHDSILKILKQTYGEDEKGWWVKGVPTQIRIACATRREEDPQRDETYNYCDILHFKKIIEQNRELFKTQLQLGQNKSNVAKEFLDNMAKFNEIRNRVAHTSRSQISNDDVNFIKNYFDPVQIFIRSCV